MFSRLTDFSYKRNRKEALEFYLAYLLLSILLGGLVGGVYGMATGRTQGAEGFQAGIRAGHVCSIVLITIISLATLKSKRLFGHFGYWLLAIVIVLLTLLAGAIFGLIPLAFLTTREKISGN